MKVEVHVVSELEKRLDVAYHLPSLRKLGIGALLLAAAVLFIWPLSAAFRRDGLSGGAVSNHHRLIESDCGKCHSSAFRAVPDEKCSSCHVAHQHTNTVPELVAAHPELRARCASCHKEHHGQGSLMPSDSPLCTGCHARIDKLAPNTAQANIQDFAHHPEFAVLAWRGNPPRFAKARLDEPKLRGGNQLKFSHAEHLGQLSAGGKPALDCASCHVATDDGKRIQPISYAANCQRCHPIEFDDRLKGSFLPHKDAGRAFEFITAALARLHVERGLPGGRRKLEEESREDELGLFTLGGACFKCHDVEAVAPSKDASQGLFQVLNPRLPAKRMPAALFDHDAHRLAPCDSCHGKVRESTSASDILLPRIARCRECHADPGNPGKIDSPCLQCHGYHPPH